MDILIALAAAVVGYLLGAISFTRVVARWAAPGEDLETTTLEFDSGRTFEMRSVSATSLTMRKGARAGCLASFLDILKGLLPTAFFWYFFPGEYYFLIASASAVAGHNFPVYYGFKGGRGMSPMYGGLLVIDWISIPITAIGGSIIGLFLLRDVFLAFTVGVVFLIPWFWYRFNDPAYIIYAVVVNILFWTAIWPELRIHLKNRREGKTSQASLGTYISRVKTLWLSRSQEADTSGSGEAEKPGVDTSDSREAEQPDPIATSSDDGD
jgi:glycerol-3-phosphate acyltransferase PlsY